MHLSRSFLEPYRGRDPFRSLLARSVFADKYARSGETFTDAVIRVVEGNTAADPTVTAEEAEALFQAIWHLEAQPPGRGWWTGGVPGIPAEARFNCYVTRIASVEDWAWLAGMLMHGGGVGADLTTIDALPGVAPGRPLLRLACASGHPNREEVGYPVDTRDEETGEHVQRVILPPLPMHHDHPVDDSREGWVDALRLVLRAAFAGVSVGLDLSAVRPRGVPIKTFGGVACGPGPLATMLREVWAIVRGAAGRKLTSVEALDVTAQIGVCIKSGNVRRSALITFSGPHDHEFRRAKSSIEKIHSHRHTTNNSVLFRAREDLDGFDWLGIVKNAAEFGDPGIANLWKARELGDLGVIATNPCGEQFLEHREACNLAEVFPGCFRPGTDPARVLRLMTRYAIRQRLEPMKDAAADEVSRRNMRIGVALGGLVDFRWDRALLASWYRVVREEANAYAAHLGRNAPITVTTIKPSGTISLLNGSSPGIHAPHAPYYLRRTRLDKDAPMALALQEAGVPCEPAVDDKTGRLLVFAFPVAAARQGIPTRDEESPRAQLERQIAVQEAWADNAVSATINFDHDRPEDLADALRELAPRLKSTSFLARFHGYQQAPYEAIDAAEFARRHAQINHDHPLVGKTGGGDAIGIDSCEGGACPVR